MSADIMSEPSSSTSARLNRGSLRVSGTSQQAVAPAPQDDPALIIGLALAFARQGPSDMRAIPPLLLDRLSDLARSGEPACRLVLDCLNRRAGAGHRTDSGQGLPTEIVSVHPAMKEDR
ncbi:hypothetical protein [Agrobacterium fabrum]|uniref:hypothetical protein n=1 Tax=Agrobacterium fabrum TaxID=1176649 RepID=UPI0015729CD1|nr:hypothetical protein [Agrobacterium fabrum]WCK77889.1 hypothetical protein G6L39_014420 [Agrobacterium fabrum]